MAVGKGSPSRPLRCSTWRAAARSGASARTRELGAGAPRPGRRASRMTSGAEPGSGRAAPSSSGSAGTGHPRRYVAVAGTVSLHSGHCI